MKKFNYKLMKLKWELSDSKKMLKNLQEDRDMSIFNAQTSSYKKVNTPLFQKIIKFIMILELKKEIKILKNKINNQTL